MLSALRARTLRVPRCAGSIRCGAPRSRSVPSRCLRMALGVGFEAPAVGDLAGAPYGAGRTPGVQARSRRRRVAVRPARCQRPSRARPGRSGTIGTGQPRLGPVERRSAPDVHRWRDRRSHVTAETKPAPHRRSLRGTIRCAALPWCEPCATRRRGQSSTPIRQTEKRRRSAIVDTFRRFSRRPLRLPLS